MGAEPNLGSEFRGRRVTVMGLGRFGGGLGVTRWLCAQGAVVRVTDLADEATLVESLRSLEGLNVERRLGGHDERDLDTCDLLVVSPAVDKARSAFFKEAVRRSIPWTSEMNLFLQRCRGRVVGITGTAGKSTTTAMIGAILQAGRQSPGRRYADVWVGGNIGRSLLDQLPAISADDVVVLELSSFQLDDAAELSRSPHVAVITNLRENHLDRHGNMEAYAAAKANIYLHQSTDDWLVVPRDEDLSLLPGNWSAKERLCRFAVDAASRRVIRSIPRGPTGRVDDGLDVPLKVPGSHNLANAAAALVVSKVLDVPDTVALRALSEFGGLPHRLEFVREYRGVKYYNDSKATTPEAAMTSLRAFSEGVVILVGGSDKGSSFAALGRLLAERAGTVICMGQTSERIHEEVLRARSSRQSPRVETACDFRGAVHLARELAQPGGVVLLSPACASYDWFRNYEERGDKFTEIVQSWG